MLPSNVELVRHILDEVSFILNAVKNKDKVSVMIRYCPVRSSEVLRSLARQAQN